MRIVKGDKIITHPKFMQLEDVAMFAEEMQQEWYNSDREDLYDTDASFIFFDYCAKKGGLTEEQRNYFLYKVGF